MGEKNLLVTPKDCSGIEATWKIVVTNPHAHQLQLRSGTPIAIINEAKTATVNALGEVPQAAGQTEATNNDEVIQTPARATNLTMEQHQQVKELVEELKHDEVQEAESEVSDDTKNDGELHLQMDVVKPEDTIDDVIETQQIVDVITPEEPRDDVMKDEDPLDVVDMAVKVQINDWLIMKLVEKVNKLEKKLNKVNFRIERELNNRASRATHSSKCKIFQPGAYSSAEVQATDSAKEKGGNNLDISNGVIKDHRHRRQRLELLIVSENSIRWVDRKSIRNQDWIEEYLESQHKPSTRSQGNAEDEKSRGGQ